MFFFYLNLSSLSFKLSFFDKKSCQSFLSLSEIFLFNYVKISTNCQFGLFDFVSLEKIQVSYIFLIFSGSPEIIFLSLSFMQVITSATKFTVTFNILFIFLCSFNIS